MVETYKISIQTLAEKLSLTPDQMIRGLAPMAKLGFVSFINSTPFNLTHD
jgi:protein tyrosine phosphatase (PTP) superfamily phosphohydrolase (DUF442 family)